MDDVLPKVLAALAVAIIGWAFNAYFFGRRLYLIQPKLFDYSDLANSKNAKTIELTVFNGGAKSEEKIVVQLSPMFTYTVVASNQSGLAVQKDGILQIERLAPKEDVTIVLTAEGGEFRKDHIIGVTSKETKGKVKASLQEAQLTPAQNALLIALIFIFFPFAGYLVGKIVETEFGELSFFSGETAQANAQELPYNQKNRRVNLVSMAQKDEKKIGIPYRILKASRTGDLVMLDIRLENRTQDRLEISVYASTPISEARDDHWSEINPNISDVMVFPGVNKDLKIVDYLPASIEPNLITLHFVVEGERGRVDYNEDVYFSTKINNP